MRPLERRGMEALYRLYGSLQSGERERVDDYARCQAERIVQSRGIVPDHPLHGVYHAMVATERQRIWEEELSTSYASRLSEILLGADSASRAAYQWSSNVRNAAAAFLHVPKPEERFDEIPGHAKA